MDPIGDLENYARRHGLAPPDYQFQSYGTLSDRLNFVCICTFKGITTKSPPVLRHDEAKKEAARLMLAELPHSAVSSMTSSLSLLLRHSPVILPVEELIKKDMVESADLEMVLTHTSLGANPQYAEFKLYGHAVTKALLTFHLYEQFDDYNQAQLTRMINELLAGSTRVHIARSIHLDRHIKILDKSQLSDGVLADTFNMVLACVFKKNEARSLMCVKLWFKDLIKHLAERERKSTGAVSFPAEIETMVDNYIGKLKECADQIKRFPPVRLVYEEIAKIGSQHAHTFIVSCSFLGRITTGEGSPRKVAEQHAAKAMLIELGVIPRTRVLQATVAMSAMESMRPRLPMLPLRKLLKFDIQDDDRALFSEALTHNSRNPHYNYQRLEFLGDAIIRLIIVKYLLEQFALTHTIESIAGACDHLVSGAVQADICKCLNIPSLIYALDSSLSDDVCGDVFEALMAALTLTMNKRDPEHFSLLAIEALMIPWFGEARIRDSLMRVPALPPVVIPPMKAELVQTVANTSNIPGLINPFLLPTQAQPSVRAMGAWAKPLDPAKLQVASIPLPQTKPAEKLPYYDPTKPRTTAPLSEFLKLDSSGQKRK